MAKQPTARYPSAGSFVRAAMDVVSPAYQPVPAAIEAPLSTPLPRTRPFPAVYPNPDDSGSIPYPPSPVAVRRRVFPGPAVLGAAAVAVLIAGLVLALASVFGGSGGAPSPTPTAAPSAPAAPPPKTPTLSEPVQGADGLGFVGETARCDPGNPPAAVVRTAKSLAVVCQNLSGTYYYRGERIRDGAHIELSNAEPVADGFDVTNPVDGVRYEVRPHRLRILSGTHVDSSEPVLQYATAS